MPKSRTKLKFRIKLHEAHLKSGLTVYAVAKKAGVSYNTVDKYVSENLIIDRLPPEIETIAAAYGLDWRDPAVVEVVDASEDSSGKFKTPLIAMA